MPSWVTWLIGFILKGFGIGSAPDPVQQAANTGEKLGKAEQASEASTGELKDVAAANQARDDVSAADLAHPDRLRAPDPFSRD